jgi:hypothetical protein
MVLLHEVHLPLLAPGPVGVKTAPVKIRLCEPWAVSGRGDLGRAIAPLRPRGVGTELGEPLGEPIERSPNTVKVH